LTGDGKKGRLRLGEILQEIPEIYREERKHFPLFDLFQKNQRFGATNDNFFNSTSETSDGLNSSIRVQPVFEQFSAEKQNPAVAAAGRMTRKSFRRLVQEETVSDGESTRLCIRVSTPLAR
jgi:hypothetical protein